MKQIFCITILSCISILNLQAQYSIGLSVNDTHIGNNIGIYASKQVGKHKTSIGFTQLLNNPQGYNKNQLYNNQGFGRDFKERMGINLSYSYSLYQYRDFYSLAIGYQFFYTHCGLKNEYLLVNTTASAQYGKPLYYYDTVEFLPADILEHYIMAECNFRLAPRINLFSKIGGGVATFYNLDKRIFSGRSTNGLFGQDYDLGYFVSLGLSYNITNKQ